MGAVGVHFARIISMHCSMRMAGMWQLEGEMYPRQRERRRRVRKIALWWDMLKARAYADHKSISSVYPLVSIRLFSKYFRIRKGSLS